MSPALRDLARLVRAPAALTVPGDVLVGAAAAGRRPGARVLATAASSACLYWAGMALNDFADRHLDATERPDRPIPSGAVSSRTALVVASGLTLAGLGLAEVAGGMRITGPLAGLVWAYDLLLKSTPLGPLAMAAARALDVLAGAGGDRLREAAPAAFLVGLHTTTVTCLSRREVSGAGPALPCATLAVTSMVAVAAVLGGGSRRRHRALAAVPAATYLATCGAAQLAAAAERSPARTRSAVSAGIHGLVPLQAALLARTGSWAALPVTAVFPVVRALGRKMSPT